MSIINNATVEMVQNVINGNTPPTYANEAGRTSNSFTVVLNGSTRTFNGSANVNLGTIYAPTSSGASGQIPVSNGYGRAPTWSDERVASINGSTSRGQYIYPPTSRGNDGYVWTGNGGNQNPSWQEPIITSVQGSSETGQSIYPPTSQGTDGYLWESNGNSVPSWQQPIITSLNGNTTRSRGIYAPTSAGSSGQVLVANGSGAPSWQTPSVPYAVNVYVKNSGDGYQESGNATYKFLKQYNLYLMRVGNCCIIGGYIDDGNFCTEDRWIRIRIPKDFGNPCSVTVTARRGRADNTAPEYCAMIDGEWVYMCCDESTRGNDHWGAFFTILCENIRR